MLALGFASGAEGLFGQASLLESLKRPVGSARNKPAKGNRLKGRRNQFQWIKQRLNLPKRSAIRPISKPRSSARRPLELKIPRQWQFWSKRFWRKKKKSSRQRIRVAR